MLVIPGPLRLLTPQKPFRSIAIELPLSSNHGWGWRGFHIGLGSNLACLFGKAYLPPLFGSDRLGLPHSSNAHHQFTAIIMKWFDQTASHVHVGMQWIDTVKF